MAISLVGTASGSNISGGNVTITLPTCLQNDIVLVMGGNADAGTAPAVTTSGYTSLDTESNSNAALNASWKRQGVSPDTTVTCNGGGDADSAVCYVAMVFRGVDTTTAIDATTTNASGNGAPNSPSITTVTAGAAVISCFVAELQDDTITAPTGYGNAVNVSRSDADPITAGAAWKAIPIAGAENPGSWTADALTDDFIAFTIALRPLAAGTFGDGVLAATGTNTASFVGSVGSSMALSVTGTGTATWTGQALSSGPGVFSATGTATMSFEGIASGDAYFTMTGCGCTVRFTGDKEFMSSVREVIESRGAASVTVN